jgi:glycosyltransferase involved in cell wall biosynthesis
VKRGRNQATMKINFLSYLDPFKYSGGGELALRTVIERGRQRGHEIHVFARRRGKLSRFAAPPMHVPPADLYLLADMFNCPEDSAKFDSALIERVVSREQYIHFDNSYVDVCTQPALPCGGHRSGCLDECGVSRAKWLYSRSLANIFVSPLHHRVVAGLVGIDSVPNPVISRPFIDTELFSNRHLPRDIDYLYVGTIAKYKGYENVKSRFAGKNILFIGKNLTQQKLVGRHIPHVPHTNLWRYYNRSKHLVHLPEWPEPQGRCVVEGSLCGCDLITNDKVGATSFDFDIRDARIIADAPDHVWREIEQRCCTSAVWGSGSTTATGHRDRKARAPRSSTASLRINFLAYLDPFRYHGGGERTSRFAIEHGRRRGHRITVYARRTGKLSRLLAPSFKDLPRADLWILSDVFNCPETHCQVDAGLLERIVDHERYIHWNHAYVDICSKPALPCKGDVTMCAPSCSLDRARWLHAGAIANVFGSPLHHRTIRNILGEEAIHAAIIWRPMIDTSLFYNRREPRDIDYLYVGTIADYKGYATLKERFGNKNIVLIGNNLTGERPIGRHIEHVAYEKLPQYYNRAQYFVHLPEWPEPQGRCVVEAALCGCQLITNDRVGATTFEFDISDPKIIADAPDHFWREVEQCYDAV